MNKHIHYEGHTLVYILGVVEEMTSGFFILEECKECSIVNFSVEHIYEKPFHDKLVKGYWGN